MFSKWNIFERGCVQQRRVSSIFDIKLVISEGHSCIYLVIREAGTCGMKEFYIFFYYSLKLEELSLPWKFKTVVRKECQQFCSLFIEQQFYVSALRLRAMQHKLNTGISGKFFWSLRRSIKTGSSWMT